MGKNNTEITSERTCRDIASEKNRTDVLSKKTNTIKANYQKELETTIKSLEGKAASLLLHSCCAPCSSYTLLYLSRYFDITVFYYNPNIDDEEEYKKRVSEQKRLIELMDLSKKASFVEGEYTPLLFHEIVRGHESDKEGGERCKLCFKMRLQKAFEFARLNGFDYYATTLTISPKKNADVINEIGAGIERRYKETHFENDVPKWLFSDLKKKNGYLTSIRLSEEYGLYRQNYCGCSYSKNNM